MAVPAVAYVLHPLRSGSAAPPVPAAPFRVRGSAATSASCRDCPTGTTRSDGLVPPVPPVPPIPPGPPVPPLSTPTETLSPGCRVRAPALQALLNITAISHRSRRATRLRTGQRERIASERSAATPLRQSQTRSFRPARMLLVRPGALGRSFGRAANCAFIGSNTCRGSVPQGYRQSRTRFPDRRATSWAPCSRRQRRERVCSYPWWLQHRRGD